MTKINFSSAVDGAKQKVRTGTFDFEDERYVFKYVERGRMWQTKKRSLFVNESLKINEEGIILSSFGEKDGEILLKRPLLGRTLMTISSGEKILIKETLTYPTKESFQICFLGEDSSGEDSFWVLPMNKNTQFARPAGFFPLRIFKKKTKDLKPREIRDLNLLVALIFYLCPNPVLR